MNVTCHISDAEMREIFFMNLPPSFWRKAILENWKLILLVGASCVYVVVTFARGGDVHWKSVVSLSTIGVLAFGAYLLKLRRSIARRAAIANFECTSIVVDGAGVTVEGGDGTIFRSWSDIHRWREGKLVFIMGDPRSVRAIPKRALDEMQTTELRSLLNANVR